MARAGTDIVLDVASLVHGLAKVTMGDFLKWNAGFFLATYFFVIGAALTHYLLKRTFIAPRQTRRRFKWQMTPYLWSADHSRPLLLASAALFGAGALVIALGAPAGVPVVLAGYVLLAWTLCSLSIWRSWARFGAQYQAALEQSPAAQRRGRRTMYVTLARIALVVAIIEEAVLLVLWALVKDPIPLLPVFLLLPVLQGTLAWLALRYLGRERGRESPGPRQTPACHAAAIRTTSGGILPMDGAIRRANMKDLRRLKRLLE